MNAYIQKLDKFKNGNNLASLELYLLKKNYQWFGIEMPLMKFAPLLVNFLVFFTILGMILVLSCMIFNGIECIYIHNNYNKYLLGNIKNLLLITTALMLIIFEVNKLDIDYRQWYSKDLEWFFDLTDYKIFNNKKLVIFLSIYAISFLGIFYLIFGIWIIKFIVNFIGLIMIYETAKTLNYYLNVKKWKSVQLDDYTFSIEEKNVLSDRNLFEHSHKHTRYFLKARLYYKIGKNRFISGQVYLDNAERSHLFDSEDTFNLKQWMAIHSEINNVYINPKKPYEAVLKNDILIRSYISKYSLLVSIIILLMIVNIFM